MIFLTFALKLAINWAEIGTVSGRWGRNIGQRVDAGTFEDLTISVMCSVGQSYLFYIIDTPWFLIPHSFTDTYVHISNRITTGRKNQSAPFSWTSKDGFQSTTRDMNDLFLEALSGVFKKHPELFAVDIKSTSDLFDQYNVFRSFWRGSESRAVAKKVTTNQTATSCIGRWKRKEAAGANQVSHNIDQHYKTRKLVRLTRQH